MSGQLDILNCGTGHLEIKFDETNKIETDKAKTIINDMLKRGYSLFVHGKDDALIRVRRFDSKSNCYIISDGPKSEKMVRLHNTKVTAIGRSAGG